MINSNDPFEKLREYAISKEEMEQIRGGSTSILKNVILQEVIDRARELGKVQNTTYSCKIDWNMPLEDWQHGHFRQLSYMSDIPINTLKRWFTQEVEFKIRNQAKILAFLGYENWQELEKQVLSSIIHTKPK